MRPLLHIGSAFMYPTLEEARSGIFREFVEEDSNKVDPEPSYKSHRIHVWYIYLHLVDFYGKRIGK